MVSFSTVIPCKYTSLYIHLTLKYKENFKFNFFESTMCDGPIWRSSIVWAYVLSYSVCWSYIWWSYVWRSSIWWSYRIVMFLCVEVLCDGPMCEGPLCDDPIGLWCFYVWKSSVMVLCVKVLYVRSYVT